MPLYDIFTIAATEKHARECCLPIILQGTVEASNAHEALLDFTFAEGGEPLDDYAYIPHADYRDTAVGYEDAEPKRPIVWLATYHRP